MSTEIRILLARLVTDLQGPAQNGLLGAGQPAFDEVREMLGLNGWFSPAEIEPRIAAPELRDPLARLIAGCHGAWNLRQLDIAGRVYQQTLHQLRLSGWFSASDVEGRLAHA